MFENIIDFATRIKKTSKQTFETGKAAAAELGATKELDLNKLFDCGKGQSFFIGRVANLSQKLHIFSKLPVVTKCHCISLKI